ncbi:MAG TPA: sensor histidine kinase, partial [Clostridiales bacterium]|nr:sensor histidine kinase [Clostridiales bacterium]
TILDFKLALAIQKGIDVNIIGVAPQSLNINDYDLCCILTNIIDNAIESCELMRRGNEKKIKCNFSVYKGFLKIEITNSVESYNPSFLTKKKDKNLHGLGLEIIKIVVEKNNGFCYFGTDNNIFRSKVLLNL